MVLVRERPQHDSDGANASGDLFKQVASATILMLTLLLLDEVALPLLAQLMVVVVCRVTCALLKLKDHWYFVRSDYTTCIEATPI